MKLKRVIVALVAVTMSATAVAQTTKAKRVDFLALALQM